MPTTLRLTTASVALAVAGTLGACSSGTFVDSTPGQGAARVALGWSDVEPFAIDLPTDEPVTDGAAVPDGSVPILVNLWASWCPPCKDELPLLEQADASGKVDVIGFSRELDADNAREALEAAGVTYPNWLDGEARMAVELDGKVPFNSVPSSALIRDGQVVAVHLGEFASVAEILEKVEQ